MDTGKLILVCKRNNTHVEIIEEGVAVMAFGMTPGGDYFCFTCRDQDRVTSLAEIRPFILLDQSR